MNRTIPRQMIIRIVVTVAAAIAIIFAFSYEAVRSTIRNNTEENYMNQVKMAAQEAEAAIRHHRQMVETYASAIHGIYASSRDIRADLDDVTEMYASQRNELVFGYWFSMQSDYKKQGRFASWYGYDKAGRISNLYQANYTDESLSRFRDDTRYDFYHGAVKKNGTYITSPYIDPYANLPIISISTPVTDAKGRVIGVAGVDIRYGDLQQIASTLTIHPTSKMLLITNEGDILYDSDGKQTGFSNIYDGSASALLPIFNKIKGQTETVVTAKYQDQSMYVFSVRLTEPAWSVMIMLPVAVVDEALVNLSIISVGTFVLLILVIYLLVFVWVRQLITKPLQQLVSASSRIAAGNYAGMLHIGVNNEFRQLGEHMNRMMEALRKQAQMEQEMKRMSSLKIVGEMAAALSHEIRNPLTTVRGFLQLLRNKPEHAKEHVYFDTMMEEMERANTIITEYLTLAQHKFAPFQLSSLNDVISHIYPLVQATATANCQHIHLELQQIPAIEMDEKEIRQLLHNLIRNGLEAMAANQSMSIRTRYEADSVWLEVEDEGAGFEAQVLESAGTPFVTTKADGTGLGLSICYSIVHRHQGQLMIQSEPGKTLIKVKFPVNQAAAAGETKPAKDSE
ncbi:sensor histidine kinase [Paenibacillus apiarius]|uniref:sensor histidine kinase n=1 Tax=Paenibacillus apiarius TaxID=46240 RepID=UPI00197E9E01|nr:sensor histidine kinase [Paenibacillus apiarius]MBN3527426.1 sensor histidine kinase [Paenibacillus apiarius]